MIAYRLTGSLQLSYAQAPYPLRPQAQVLSIFDEVLHDLVDMTPSRPVTPLVRISVNVTERFANT